MWLLGLLAGTLVCVSHFPGLRFPAIVRAGSVFQSRKRLSEPEALATVSPALIVSLMPSSVSGEGDEVS